MEGRLLGTGGVLISSGRGLSREERFISKGKEAGKSRASAGIGCDAPCVGRMEWKWAELPKQGTHRCGLATGEGSSHTDILEE